MNQQDEPSIVSTERTYLDHIKFSGCADRATRYAPILKFDNINLNLVNGTKIITELNSKIDNLTKRVAVLEKKRDEDLFKTQTNIRVSMRLHSLRYSLERCKAKKNNLYRVIDSFLTKHGIDTEKL